MSTSTSSDQLAAPANIEQSENGSNLHSVIFFSFAMGFYTMVYFATLYVYLARKTTQRIVVVVTITAIYVLNLLLFACQWWLVQWEYIANGQTQDSVFVAYYISPVWVNLVIFITSVVAILLADGLLIWRCYYVWNRSVRILALLLVLWFAEFGVSVTSVVVESIVGVKTTHQLALLANHLVSAQYFLAFFTTVTTTFLIAYRIYTVSKRGVVVGVSSGRRFRHILDIVIQSSVVYSLTLLLVAIGYVLPESVGNGSNPSGFAFINYSSVLVFTMPGLAPTVMVARVALLAADSTDLSTAPPRLSALNFGGDDTAHSSETAGGLDSNFVMSSGDVDHDMPETPEKYGTNCA